MPKQKRVRCFGHGLLHMGPHYHTPWEDVWLRWKGSDRKVYRAAPCLISANDVRGTLEASQQMLILEPTSKYREYYEEDIKKAQEMLAYLEEHPYHVKVDGFPDVTTRAPLIDRAEAECMLRHLLEVRYGVTNPKFVWEKPDRTFGPILPHSFASLEPTEA